LTSRKPRFSVRGSGTRSGGAPGLADFGRVWTGDALAEIGEEPGR